MDITPEKRAEAIKAAGGKDQYILGLERAARRLYTILARIAPNEIPDAPDMRVIKEGKS